MAQAELAALLDALPERPFHATEWLEQTLSSRWSDFTPAAPAEEDAPQRVRAWSVGCVLGNETLVQSRPVVRDDKLVFLDDFLRTAAPCTIATFATTAEASRPTNAGVHRFQRWIGATSHSRLLDGEKAVAVDLRRQLRDSLPPFLSRSALRGGDDELLFFSFLARLHEVGGLGSAYADRQTIRAGLQKLTDDIESLLGEPFELNLMVFDGKSFAALHQGGTLTRWDAPEREIPRHRTGPIPAAGIPRGAVLFVLSRNGQRDPNADPLPGGVFAVDPSNPVQIER